MKLLFSAAIVSLFAGSAAHANIGIYAGTEEHRSAYQSYDVGMHGGSSKATTRLFLIHEVETGRTLEIILQAKSYTVREEKKLMRVDIGPAPSGIQTTILRDANKVVSAGMQGQISTTTWTGSANVKGKSVVDPVSGFKKDPVTGLISFIPKTLKSANTFDSVAGDGSWGSERYNATVSIMQELTRDSNKAGESFDAAVLRLKTWLEGRGNVNSGL